MKIAIIILNWYGTEDTCECLSALENSDEIENTKIYLVDNGSDYEFIRRIEKDYPHVEIIKNSDNLGFAGGNNVAIKKIIETETEYIFLLNNDTVIENNLISKLFKYIKNIEEDCIIGPKILFYNRRNVIWAAGGVVNKLLGKAVNRGFNEIDRGQYEKIENVDFISGCAMLINKRIFEKIGFFDEDYFSYYEDVDFCLRARKSGIKLLYFPEGVVYHKASKSTGGEYSLFQSYFRIRNRLLFVLKNMNIVHRFIFVLIVLPLILIRDTFRYLLKRKFKELNSFYSGILNIIFPENKKYSKERFILKCN